MSRSEQPASGPDELNRPDADGGTDGTGGVTHVASLGGGVIGRSWTALFLAAGKSVAVFDPDPRAEDRVRQAVESAWPVLTELGLTEHGDPEGLRFCADARTAVDGAGFVQESVPERLDLKHALYADIEPALGAGTVVASSASGLTLSEMQGGWRDPERFVLGHPFNPPHLIPLVEVMGNDRTAAGVVDRARAVYESAGKVTIEVRREVPGHVANRLQAALWREAIHLVGEGVASVEDVDTAVSAGPGLRWAAMGPTLLFHLGAGDGGLEDFCERYADSFNRWFDDLGGPYLDGPTARRLVDGLRPVTGSRSVDELSRQRDALLTGLIALAREHRGQPPTDGR
ncbi:3-hydroxyacyl-CoA dehydrogenase NAD-binding domain-containing protein [Streptomyces nanshensis]|uniref:3-hydroxyacyl-CoA dehydrogenase NAD-binding domain-containing protein n=1 Tax=Streptomyces nanshensis TaxID=518642 RepID=UPI001FD3E117|nr:3-hydroxyacyl-CoA dehydrogenase NAD-binding domain-containing protein [Streptomyces nanshensis]